VDNDDIQEERQVTGDDMVDRVSHDDTCLLDDDDNEGAGKVDRITHNRGVKDFDSRIFDVPHWRRRCGRCIVQMLTWSWRRGKKGGLKNKC
jgi:hypothetical protein